MNARADELVRTGKLYSREPAGSPVDVVGHTVERSEEVLTPLALQLLAHLHRRFNPRRLELLAAREQRQRELDAGALPDFLPQTAAVRSGQWRGSPGPAPPPPPPGGGKEPGGRQEGIQPRDSPGGLVLSPS